VQAAAGDQARKNGGSREFGTSCILDLRQEIREGLENSKLSLLLPPGRYRWAVGGGGKAGCAILETMKASDGNNEDCTRA